jgi:hypothetical protein
VIQKDTPCNQQKIGARPKVPNLIVRSTLRRLPWSGCPNLLHDPRHTALPPPPDSISGPNSLMLRAPQSLADDNSKPSQTGFNPRRPIKIASSRATRRFRGTKQNPTPPDLLGIDRRLTDAHDTS